MTDSNPFNPCVHTLPEEFEFDVKLNSDEGSSLTINYDITARSPDNYLIDEISLIGQQAACATSSFDPRWQTWVTTQSWALQTLDSDVNPDLFQFFVDLHKAQLDSAVIEHFKGLALADEILAQVKAQEVADLAECEAPQGPFG
jgi:hypothetical protein